MNMQRSNIQNTEEQYEQGQDIELKDNTKQLKLIIIPLMRIKFLEHGQHGTQKYLTDNGVNIPAMKKGAIYADSDDSGVKGMTEKS